MKFFSDDKEIFTASAPGRLDVMGGIADYSGSLLLQLPIAEKLTVQIQQRDDSIISCLSLLPPKNVSEFQIDYSLLKNKSAKEAGELIRSKENGDWAAYVIGCLFILNSEKNISVNGMSISIHSEIPLGKGVASSAALEVAVMNAICKLYNINLTEIELPLLAQRVENNFVGAACGLMDQLTVHLGQKNKLLPIVCQPHKVFPSLTVSKGIQFSGIDSGVRHAVGGSSYADVRTATFMAYSVIASLEGVSADELMKAKKENNFSSLPYRGYLANVSVSDFENKYASQLPEKISGGHFLNKYKISIDTVTNVEEGKNYDLLACGRHPIYENHRVNLFFQLLQQFKKATDKEKLLRLLGELMLQTHASYSSVGLGNPATDRIVDAVKQAGYSSGVYGARVTGGGSGGTVAILSYGKQGKQTVKKIFNQYKKDSGQKIFLFSGSEHGALIYNQQIKQHDYIDA